MKKIFYLMSISVFPFLVSCERDDLATTETVSESEKVTIIPKLNARVISGIIHFSDMDAFRQTVAYLDKYEDFRFESMDSGFESFNKKRLELEANAERPSEELFNRYFNVISVDGEDMIVSKIADGILEKIVNSNGDFVIARELYKIENNILSKIELSSSATSYVKVADVNTVIERVRFTTGSKLRDINGGGAYSCGGSQYRLLGDFVNFNIGIFQRLSIQIKHHRQNGSFWSWLDPWVKQDVSYIGYNATFTIQIAAPLPPATINLTGGCNNCNEINRTVDWNVGFAGPTQWSNKYGNFWSNADCGGAWFSF